MKKLSPNERTMISSDSLLELMGSKFITDREALIYITMRDHSFFNKDGTRNRCKYSAIPIAKQMGVNKNKVIYKLKSLEEKGFITPIYRTMKKGKKIKEFGNYKEVLKQGVNSFLGTEYIIHNLPNEEKNIKIYIENKKKRKSEIKNNT